MTDENVYVACISEGRYRIKGAHPGSAVLGDVISWLTRRKEVVEFVYRQNSGALDLQYRGAPMAAGAFLRSLQDHLFTLRRAPKVSVRVLVSHSLPGRLRVRLEGAEDDHALRLAEWMPTRPGVLRASASPGSHSVVILYDETITNMRTLVGAIRQSEPREWPAAPVVEIPRKQWRNVTFSTGVLAASATGIAPAGALAVGVALTAIPPVRRALKAMSERRVSVDLLDVAAVGISIATGQPTTGAVITWLLSLGDLLLERTADRARFAISKLIHLDASEAWRIEGDKTVKVTPAKLKVGDRIVVDGGRRVAADGTVVSGHASVDEKALTGESEPREVGPGDRVLAATVAVDGQIVIEVERVGLDTTAAKIVQVLESAGTKPMTLQKNAEKITDRLVLPTFGLAGGAMALAGDINRMTAVLITDFGTGIRVALPTSALAAMTLAARDGILVKGAQYLERLSKTDLIVFDKTGTLTTGMPEIVDVTAVNGVPKLEVLRLAAGAEGLAAHPIAEAVKRRALAEGLTVPEAELGTGHYVIGRGLSAVVEGRVVLIGNPRYLAEHDVNLGPVQAAMTRHKTLPASTLLVAVERKLVGAMAYADRPRPESKAVVERLKAGGRRRVVLLSGDSKSAVDATAKAIGVDEARAEMMPEEKAAYVREMQRQGKVVAMIGDGINDAPALALADVGISLSGSTDVALETADVVLQGDGLKKLPLAFESGERAMRTVKRGLGIVIVPNAVAIVLGALGLLPPALAAVVNNGSTVVAALSSIAPLMRFGRKRP